MFLESLTRAEPQLRDSPGFDIAKQLDLAPRPADSDTAD